MKLLEREQYSLLMRYCLLMKELVHSNQPHSRLLSQEKILSRLKVSSHLSLVTGLKVNRVVLLLRSLRLKILELSLQSTILPNLILDGEMTLVRLAKTIRLLLTMITIKIFHTLLRVLFLGKHSLHLSIA